MMIQMVGKRVPAAFGICYAHFAPTGGCGQPNLCGLRSSSEAAKTKTLRCLATCLWLRSARNMQLFCATTAQTSRTPSFLGVEIPSAAQRLKVDDDTNGWQACAGCIRNLIGQVASRVVRVDDGCAGCGIDFGHDKWI